MKAASGKAYTINGYVNDQNLVERVETWVGDNLMGDMHVVATYSGWKDMGGAMAPAKIVQTRGGWPFFDVDVTSASINPANLAALAPAPAPPAGRGGGPPPGGAPGGPPAMTVTAEKLGDGLYRLTTGPGSYDSLRGGVQGLRDDARGRPAGGPRRSRTSPRPRSSFRTSRCATCGTRTRTRTTPADCRRSWPRA